MIESPLRRSARAPRLRSGNARPRRRVVPERFAAVILRLPQPMVVASAEAERGSKRRLWIAAACTAALLAVAAGVWLYQSDAPAAPTPEEIFVLEEIPPPENTPVPPDPAPPTPPTEVIPQEAPPPQFGMQEEALSEAGEMSVATGNTLMTQADSVVKAPVAALPAAPEFFDRPPKILSAPEAEYPVRALDLGLQGTSVIRIVIDTEGRVTQVSVEKSGGRDFDQSALKAARATRFQPFTRGGKPIAMEFLRPYKFELE